MKAVGGGFELGGLGSNDVVVSSSHATSAQTWTVAGQEIGNGTSSSWTIQAYVICA
jgi:hypothetical protein